MTLLRYRKDVRRIRYQGKGQQEIEAFNPYSKAVIVDLAACHTAAKGYHLSRCDRQELETWPTPTIAAENADQNKPH